MIPYPGESLMVDYHVDIAGTAPSPVPNVVVIQQRPGVCTFKAGDVVDLYSELGAWYLDDGEDPGPLEFSWVVEVVGGSGMLTLSEGMGSVSVSLGSHSVSGVQTLVVPSTVITVADINESTAVLRVDCTSGPVLVQQAKVRAWPVSGPLGGWSGDTYPAWTQQGTPVAWGTGRAVFESTFLPFGTDIDMMWAAANNQLQAHADETLNVSGVTYAGPVPIAGVVRVDLRASHNLVTNAGSAQTDAPTLDAVIVTRPEALPRLNPADGLIEGVDWITPPTEVQSGGSRHGVQPVGGTAYNDWVNAGVAHLHVVDAGQGELLHVAARPLAHDPAYGPWYRPPDVAPGYFLEFEDAEALPAPALPMPHEDIVLINSSHQWLLADAELPTDPGGTEDGGNSVQLLDAYRYQVGTGPYNREGNAEPLAYVAHYPAYRVWTLNPPAQVRPLRQYHRDDGRGGTPPRAFGGASRIRTGRAYGYD